jgi:hypothetical protein
MRTPKSRWWAKQDFLIAPKGFWEISDAELEEKTGGCGPTGILDVLIPDTMWGLNQKPG